VTVLVTASSTSPVICTRMTTRPLRTYTPAGVEDALSPAPETSLDFAP